MPPGAMAAGLPVVMGNMRCILVHARKAARFGYPSEQPKKRSCTMKTLRSYLGGRWIEGTGAPQVLVNPATEEPLAQVSSDGLDLALALAYSRDTGGPALRALSFA